MILIAGAKFASSKSVCGIQAGVQTDQSDRTRRACLFRATERLGFNWINLSQLTAMIGNK